MKNSKTQKELTKAWVKMELNSSYGFPPIPVVSMVYDENKTISNIKKLLLNRMKVIHLN